jgi:aromatic-L-amino-acid/L-tryptophan decarboxylase
VTPEQFRRIGHQLIDRIADYRAGVADRPVMSQVKPGALRAALPAAPPLHPEPFEAVFADLDRLIMPGLSHWQHPRFFGYFPANSELSSVLGDYLSAGLGVLGLSWQASPALTELEEVVADWMRQMVGLADAWSGVIQDTASTATLVALICARERTSGYGLAGGGLQASAAPLIVYASRHAHSSVDKAALLAGFGRDNIRLIDIDASFAMRPDALEAAISTDRAAGRTPCAVVATTGTTTTTALDPVEAIGAVARRHGLWLHVDSAMAGSAMILPECRWMWRGVEGADSVVLNPHKWLGAAFDCSLYYVRDPEHLIRVMSTNPSYLQTSVDGEVKNLRDWGIPLGRRFRALKLWCLLRAEGVEGLQARLRRDIANARWLVDEVARAPDWKLLAPTPLQTLCLRHEPAGLTGEALDRHTLGWTEAVNRSGAAYLTPATLDERWMVRVSIGALPTEREHVADLWRAIREAAEAAAGR